MPLSANQVMTSAGRPGTTGLGVAGLLLAAWWGGRYSQTGTFPAHSQLWQSQVARPAASIFTERHGFFWFGFFRWALHFRQVVVCSPTE